MHFWNRKNTAVYLFYSTAQMFYFEKCCSQPVILFILELLEVRHKDTTRAIWKTGNVLRHSTKPRGSSSSSGFYGSWQKLRIKACYCKKKGTVRTKWKLCMYDTWTCQGNMISIDGFLPVRRRSYRIQIWNTNYWLILKPMKKQIIYTEQFSRHFHT
jgi:hypothetical protein